MCDGVRRRPRNGIGRSDRQPLDWRVNQQVSDVLLDHRNPSGLQVLLQLA
jgi:hypothetical protein